MIYFAAFFAAFFATLVITGLYSLAGAARKMCIELGLIADRLGSCADELEIRNERELLRPRDTRAMPRRYIVSANGRAQKVKQS